MGDSKQRACHGRILVRHYPSPEEILSGRPRWESAECDRMVMLQTRRFNLDLEPFAEVRRFIDSFCASAHVTPRTSDNLILIVEELSANTMDHGYPPKNDITERSIWLTLSVADRDIVVLYEDAAPAHDPFRTIVPPDYSGPPENWRIGGWGIPLVANLANNLRYERSGGRNRIRFTLPIDRPQEA